MFYNVAVNEKYNKQDMKKILATGNFLAFNTIIQTLPRQREFLYRSDIELSEGELVEVPFGSNDLTFFGCVIEQVGDDEAQSEDKIKKVYNKVDKLSLLPIM